MSNFKIILVMISIFIISFSSFSVFAYKFPTGLEVTEKKFFSKNFDNGNRIILIGSSHVGQLNTTHINNNLKNKINYEIINLSYNGDTPSRRIQIINEMITLRPKIVIYGISYRDIQTQINENPLPDPKWFLNQFSKEEFHSDITVNPKLITLNFVRGLTDTSNSQKTDIVFENTPFFKYNPDSQMHIVNDKELEKQSKISESARFNLERPIHNKEVKHLIEIIQKFKQNNIKIVLFLTPLNNHYLNTISPTQHEIFNSTVDYIKNETHVPIYDLQYKYSSMPIWANISHVAFNEKSLIYSDDVSKIILDELDQ